MKSAAHQYEDKLLEFAYGELPQHEADAVDAHVRGCNRCAASLSEIRGVRATMAQLPMEAAPDAGLESLLAYAEQAAKRTSNKAAPSLWKRFLAPLASVMAIATVGVVAYRANQEFDTRPEAAIADQKVAERSKNQVAPKADPVAVATPPADQLAQQQEVTPTAPAPIVAAASPQAPMEEEERSNKLKGKERKSAEDGKKAALDDLNESGGKRGDVWVPEPKAAPQSVTRRAQTTKAPPQPVGNDEQVARSDNFSDVGVRGAGLAKTAPPPPPAPPVKQPAQDKVGYGLSPGGPQADTYGGVAESETPAVKPAPMKELAEKQKAEKKEEASKKDSAGEQWAPPPAVALAPSPTPSGSSSSYAPSAPSKKLKGSLKLPQQIRDEGRTSLGSESDDSGLLEKSDSLAANSDGKFRQRQAEAARTQSLESARVASSRGDRVSEIRLLAQLLENGATGYERLEALKRICDAYEFLGEADTAAPFCDQVLREFPTSAAAKAVSDRRKNVQRAPKPSPKSAAPSRERNFDSDSVKPAEAAPAQAY